MKPDWFYFGCYHRPGHYVFKRGMTSVYVAPWERLGRFDGMLAPPDSAEGYVATLSRLGGWGLSAVAFWDYTVDTRGGCNSIFFAPSLTAAPQEILDGARAAFPEVWARLPTIVWHSSVALGATP